MRSGEKERKNTPKKRPLVLKMAPDAAASGPFQIFASPTFNRYGEPDEPDSLSRSPTSVAELEDEALPRICFPRTSWAQNVTVSPTKRAIHIELGTVTFNPLSIWERITCHVVTVTFTLRNDTDFTPKEIEATKSIWQIGEDAGAFYTIPRMEAQAACSDDVFFNGCFVCKSTCLDDILLNDCSVYRAHIKPSKLQTKPWTKPARRERAHGRPPEPDLTELCTSDQHGTSATFSRVLKGLEPETTNVDTDRIPFLPSICSSPVLEFGFLKSAIATDPAELLCPLHFTPIKPPRDGAHETRAPYA
jgi:hypothetical protein